MSLAEDEWAVAGDFSSNFGSLRKEAVLTGASVAPLRFGLFAFSKSVKTHFKGTEAIGDGNHGFLSERVTHETAGETGYLKELCQCVQWAVSGQSPLHVLVMPELSVCPRGLDAVREAISREGSLCLVAPGSFHAPSREHDGRHANAAPIWLVEDDGTVRELSPYEKHDPFSMEVSRLPERDERFIDLVQKAKEAECVRVKEDISSSGRMRLISTPVGVFAVTICKDFLFADNMRLTDAFKIADHLLVVSMNPEPGPFLYEAWKKVYFCTAVYYVNAMQACAGGKNPAEAAFWWLPCEINRKKHVAYYAQPRKGHEQIPETGRVPVLEIPVPRKMFIE